MRKSNICKLAVILILSTQNKLDAQKIELLQTTVLELFPSASALEFHKNKLYVIGDDAKDIWIVNNQHLFLDSIILFNSVAVRINKDIKADLEAATIVDDKYLVAFSSLSTTQRNKIVTVNLTNNQARTQTYNLAKVNLPELNIEGAAMAGNQLILSNRANNTNKTNYLVITKFKNGKINNKSAQLISLQLPASKNVVGISGLAYLKEKDILLFTASTENTINAYSDGEIGESYLGYISNISRELKNKEIIIQHLIRLNEIFSTKVPQKIESVAVEQVEGDLITMHLAADNDNGKSTLFKVRMTLPQPKDNP